MLNCIREVTIKSSSANSQAIDKVGGGVAFLIYGFSLNAQLRDTDDLIYLRHMFTCVTYANKYV